MQKSWHGLARKLAARGHEVTIVAREFPGQPRKESVDGVRFQRAGGFSQGRYVTWDLARDFAYAVNVLPRLPKADILVTNDFWVPALAARFRPSAGAVVISAGRYPKGQYRLYRGVSRIVAISSAVGRAIMDQQPTLANRTVVIPLPIDLELFGPPVSRDRGAGRSVRYIGRIHPEKGIELLLGAFARVAARFPEWSLKLVGPSLEAEGGGGEAFAAAMRTKSRDLRVQWSGPVWDPADLAAEYGAGDLFCYPSLAERGEAFGVAALESMAAGVPPIVSDLACFRDFVRHDRNGWVFDHRGPGAEEALAETLARAMEYLAPRERLGEAARREAERFGFDAIARDYLAEFERILAEG
jgi:glycosyltransferase involved in cell wall biosynthesis